MRKASDNERSSGWEKIVEEGKEVDESREGSEVAGGGIITFASESLKERRSALVPD